LNFDIQA